MAVYAAMSGAGAAVGLIAGGLLTDYLSWRWVLFVNVPIGLFVAYLAPRVLGESKPVHGEIDVLGAAVGTVGLTTLVFGITRAGNPDYGFGDAVVVASFVIAAILLAFFLLIESRAEHPIMPLRLFADRNRSGSYAVMLLVGAAMFAMFYFLSLFVQQILGYSPVKAGLAFLPFTIGIVIGAGVASQLAPRLAPRVIAGAGLAMATVGIFWFGQLDVSSSYLDGLLWPMLVTSVGMGLAFVALTLTAVSGVAQHESGIASALLNTMQQVGGSLGLAALATIATTAANDRLPHADLAFFAAIKSGSAELFAKAAEALTRGYTVAFMVGSIMTLAGLVITVLAINAKKQRATEDEQAPAAQLG
jgi:MFS family permease